MRRISLESSRTYRVSPSGLKAWNSGFANTTHPGTNSADTGERWDRSFGSRNSNWWTWPDFVPPSVLLVDDIHNKESSIAELFPEYGIKHVLICKRILRRNSKTLRACWADWFMSHTDTFPDFFLGFGKAGIDADPTRNENYNWTLARILSSCWRQCDENWRLTGRWIYEIRDKPWCNGMLHSPSITSPLHAKGDFPRLLFNSRYIIRIHHPWSSPLT